jgi:hypothetical protein
VEIYIRGQRQGLTLRPAHDDGSFTGANLQRPALERLPRHECGQSTAWFCIRSIASVISFDFARLMRMFEQGKLRVSDATVNSSTPMGG